MEKLENGKKMCFHLTPINMGYMKCNHNDGKFCTRDEKGCHYDGGKEEQEIKLKNKKKIRS